MDVTFQDYVTAFHVAFAEDAYEDMCEALHNMRAYIPSVSEDDNDAFIYQEILNACENKAFTKRDRVLQRFRNVSQSRASDIQSCVAAFVMCIDIQAIQQNDDNLGFFRTFLSKEYEKQATILYQRLCHHKSQAVSNESGYIDRSVYVQALIEMMRRVMDVFDVLHETLKSYFNGRDILKDLFAPVHAICMEFTLETIQLFSNEARITAWEKKAGEHARRQANDEPLPIEMDESLQMLDLFLDEISCILRLLSSYQSCIQNVETQTSGNKEIETRFQRKCQELYGVYLLLERFYIFQSVHKSIEIAELQTLQSRIFVSTMVEDTFYVLNKVLSRASQSLHYHSALSVVSALADVLESKYLPAILQLPNRSFSIPEETQSTALSPKEEGDTLSFSDLMVQVMEEDLQAKVQEEAKLIMAINSAFCSMQCITTLIAKTDEMSSSIFPDQTNISDCVPKPLAELKAVFDEIVENEIRTIMEKSIKPTIEPLLYDCIERCCRYKLTSAEYDALGVQPSPLNQFMEKHIAQNACLKRYQSALCHDTFELLVQAFAKDLTRWMEEAIVLIQFPVNELGAMQLEREISDTFDKLSQYAEKSLRGSFARLFQMTLVLTLLQPRDLLSSYDPTRFERESLDATTIETILHMRVEFEKHQVEEAVRIWREKKELVEVEH